MIEKGNQIYLEIQLWGAYPLHGVRKVQLSNVSYFKNTFDLWTMLFFMAAPSLDLTT